MSEQRAPAIGRRGGLSRYLAPIVLAVAAAAAVAVVVTAPDHSGRRARAARAPHATARRPPPYWIVRPGDTFMEIAAKSGVSVAQLQAFNPVVDPLSLVPGQRLNLWLHPPKPRPKPLPLGPLYWTVRPGESFGSIAAKTGINILTLERLNPRLKPATLWPGDRLRLRARLLAPSSLPRLAGAAGHAQLVSADAGGVPCRDPAGMPPAPSRDQQVESIGGGCGGRGPIGHRRRGSHQSVRPFGPMLSSFNH